MAILAGFVVQGATEWRSSTKHSSNLELYDEPVWGGASIGNHAPPGPHNTVYNQPTSGLGLTFQGGRVRSFGDHYYHRVHVIPREINVGNVTKEITKEVEVWNAHLATKNLGSIGEDGTTGMTLTPPVGYGNPPSDFLPTESRLYEITVSASGAPTVNATYTFNFPAESPDLVVFGRRIIPLPFSPDWGRGVIEAMGWLTNVLKTRDGLEQRIRRRAHPRLSFRYRIQPMNEDGPLFEHLLYGWQSRLFGIPAWHQARHLTAGASAGATSIQVDTSDADYQVGGMALLYRDARYAETVEVQAVNAGSIALDPSSATTKDWTTRDRVMPMYSGRLQKSIRANNLHIKAAQVEIIANIEEVVQIPTAAPATTYQGMEVLEKPGNRVQGYQETWLREEREDLDPQIGLPSTEDPLSRPHKLKTYMWDFHTRAEAYAFRQTLGWMAGQLRTFWLEERSDDLLLVEQMQDAQTGMKVRWEGYSNLVAEDIGRRDLSIRLKDGTVFRRRIIDSIDNNDGTESLTLDSALGQIVDPTDILQIGYLAPVRLNHDTVDLFYFTTGVARIQATVRLMPQ